eukprot:1144453-Pelagomonas_calceolata.AAC.4
MEQAVEAVACACTGICTGVGAGAACQSGAAACLGAVRAQAGSSAAPLWHCFRQPCRMAASS